MRLFQYSILCDSLHSWRPPPFSLTMRLSQPGSCECSRCTASIVVPRPLVLSNTCQSIEELNLVSDEIVLQMYLSFNELPAVFKVTHIFMILPNTPRNAAVWPFSPTTFTYVHQSANKRFMGASFQTENKSRCICYRRTQFLSSSMIVTRGHRK